MSSEGGGGWRNGDEWRNALDALEHRLERQIRRSLDPIAEDVKEVKVAVQAQNGRVGRLEQDRVRRDTQDEVRAELAKTAVETAATAAAEVVLRHERSRRWWLGVSTVITGGIVAVTTLTSLLAQHLAH